MARQFGKAVADEINAAFDAGDKSVVDALDFYIHAGTTLNVVKDELGHGEFVKWVEKWITSRSVGQCRRYMRVARDCAGLTKTDTRARFGNDASLRSLLTYMQNRESKNLKGGGFEVEDSENGGDVVMDDPLGNEAPFDADEDTDEGEYEDDGEPDVVAMKIPKRVQEAWEDRKRFRAAVRYFRKGLKIIDELGKCPGGIAMEPNQPITDVKNAIEYLQETTPVAVCPYCKGYKRTKKKCDCLGRGWLTKNEYVKVPVELRNGSS